MHAVVALVKGQTTATSTISFMMEAFSQTRRELKYHYCPSSPYYNLVMHKFALHNRICLCPPIE